MSVRSLLSELVELLSLDERKALPVGTVSTYKDGSKRIKLKSGKWGWYGKKHKLAKLAKLAKKKSKLTKKLAKSALGKKAKSGLKQKLSVKTPDWYNSAFALEKEITTKAQVAYEKKGFSKDEAAYAASAITEWHTSSVSKGAAHLRGVVSVLIGRSLADEKVALKSALKTYKGHDAPPDDGTEMEHAFKGDPPPKPSVPKSAIAKLTKISQAAYKSDTVTLYRGVEKGVFEDAKNSGALKVGALSSWSESPYIAKTFTGIGGKKGGVLKVEVPRKQIAMSYRACPNLLDGEKEVVLACKGAIKASEWVAESKNEEDRYETIELEDGAELQVSDEPEEGAADGYDDWMRQFRKRS